MIRAVIFDCYGVLATESWTQSRDRHFWTVNEALLAYIRQQLRPSYQLGILSNSGQDRLSELFSDEQRGLFDDIVLSYQVKLTKPDERIFYLAADRLDCLPEECVFVDDVERYCTAAEATGMKSLLYVSYEQFEQGIANLLE